jgi:hypothetical protein
MNADQKKIARIAEIAKIENLKNQLCNIADKMQTPQTSHI